MKLDDFSSMEDIKKIALKLPYETQIHVYWPSINRMRRYQVHHYSSMDYSYNINKSILLIRMPEQAYVTPILDSWEDIILKEGLRRENIFVPFSNGDYPIECENFWSNLNSLVSELKTSN